MTLNGRNVTLVEMKSSYGAHHKNFNEDRRIISAAKCRPIVLVSKNIKYVRGFLGERPSNDSAVVCSGYIIQATHVILFTARC